MDDLTPFLAVLGLAFFDILFPVGYYLWGVPLLLVVSYLLETDQMSLLESFLMCMLGSYMGASTNFVLARYAGERISFRRWKSAVGALERIRNLGLTARSILPFLIAMRFTAITRPSGAIAVGMVNVPLRQFLALELIACATWISFWIVIAAALPTMFDLSGGYEIFECLKSWNLTCFE